MTTNRSSFDTYDDQNSQEFVKCVVVGDTAVGKTRFICSYLLNQTKIPVKVLYKKPHTPTVFAIDQYISNPFIQDRAKLVIDGIIVQLRIWDTFGDHEKNRKYAYQDAHLVLLCFNIGQYSSIENVDIWYGEIKKYCPRALIVLVGTQLDRRHTDPKAFKKATPITTLTDVLSHSAHGLLKKSMFTNQALISPTKGRQVSQDIGAVAYFEISVVTKHGIDDIFNSAVRHVLLARRHSRPFFLSHLKYVKKPKIQAPFLQPKEEPPIIKIISPDIPLDFSCLFMDQSCYDVEFLVDSQIFYAHSVVLISSSEIFKTLLLHNLVMNRLGVVAGEHKFPQPGPLCLVNGNINGILCPGLPRGFSTIDVLADPNSKCKIFIKVANISAPFFHNILEFVYCGKIRNLCDTMQLLEIATYLQMDMLYMYVSSILSEQTNVDIQNILQEKRISVLTGFLNSKIYSDVSFLVADAVIPSHKQLLIARCSMMAGMFRENSFKESVTEQVDFTRTNSDSLLSVLNYLYSGQCNVLVDSYGTLQLANFLCLSGFVKLCEKRITESMSEMDKNQNVDLYSVVIETFHFGNVHNAFQLSAWCLHYMATHYNEMCRHQDKQVKCLDSTTQTFLEKHRWPPVWYLKERDHYERVMRELDREANEKEVRKRHKTSSSCFR